MFIKEKFIKFLNNYLNTVFVFIKCLIDNKENNSLVFKRIRVLCETNEFNELKNIILNNSEMSIFVLNYCIDNQFYAILDKLLFERIIDVNSVLNDYNLTSIHRAVQMRDEKLLKIILYHGSNLMTRDINGNTALHALMQTMKCHQVQIKHENDKTILILEMFIEHAGVNSIKMLNAKNEWNKSVLHYAIMNVNKLNVQLMTRIVAKLLEHGANPDIEDWAHRTPLYFAICEQNILQNKPIIDLLLSAKCDSLNIYHSNNFIKHMSLKHICREFCHKNNILSKMPNDLPKDLNQFLNKKLIVF